METRRILPLGLFLAFHCLSLCWFVAPCNAQESRVEAPLTEAALLAENASPSGASQSETQSSVVSLPRSAVLVGGLTVFLLSIFVGVEVITKVPPTLHTPLMSGSNAISGITIVGAILVAGHAAGGLGTFLGFVAVILAMINVVGGFLVTHRMLLMFKKR